ncbi:glycosyltransferase [Actinoplanes sp. NPDC049668]|uniref:glycosyltransferase n=1 Tax=unclassified Actinoplanes TaxID=2626549 RepID=UPI0033BC4589
MPRAEPLVFDCSGVGAGGITRVLTELVRHWPAGERLEVVAAPADWAVPDDARTDVAVVSRQVASRRRTITAAAAGLRRAAGPVLSLSPSLAVAGARVPVATIVHDLAFRLWPQGLSTSQLQYRRLSYATALRRSARLFCVSERTRHDLQGLYGRHGDRAGVWYPGCDLAEPGRLPAGLDGDYLVVAGHAGHKGVELAIEAMHRLPRYRLVVLTGGSGISWPAGPAGRVLSLGRLTEAEYAATLAGAAAFLMPSHFEGYGLPAVEALRLGTPTVISPDPALHEATDGAAVRMTSWTASALVNAVERIDRARPVVAGPPGRRWREAAEDLAERLAG